jgi:transposase
VSFNTVSRALHRRGWSRKVAKKEAAQRSYVARVAYLARCAEWPVQQLVFVDESACCGRTGSRRYGWSPVNTRSRDIEVLKRSERWSVLYALSVNVYLEDPLIIQGSVTAKDFNEWIEGAVIPQCSAGTIFVMDNASIHHSDDLLAIVEGAGMQLEYLPPYSPDFNPIEQSFNVVMAWVRRHIEEAQIEDNFEEFLKRAVREVSGRNPRGWFRESGYEA